MTTTTSPLKKSGMMKFGFAALATAALTIGGLTPAHAADVQIGPELVAGYEDGNEGTPGYNYDQWHVGNTENPEATVDQSLTFNECSVTFQAPVERTVTQLLKGFPIDARPTNVDTLQAIIGSIAVEVESGSVTIQLPFFERYDNNETSWRGTFRNADAFGPGVHGLAPDTPLINDTMDPQLWFDWSNGDSVDDMYAAMDYWTEDDGSSFELLGIGITGEPGTVVNSISFGGDTYYFGTGDCTPAVPVVPADPADPADPVTPAAPKKPVAVETGL